LNMKATVDYWWLNIRKPPLDILCDFWIGLDCWQGVDDEGM
jgi:hypothetical protein